MITVRVQIAADVMTEVKSWLLYKGFGQLGEGPTYF